VRKGGSTARPRPEKEKTAANQSETGCSRSRKPPIKLPTAATGGSPSRLRTRHFQGSHLSVDSDGFSGAGTGASTAGNAVISVNDSLVVFDLDGTNRAGSFASAAADALFGINFSSHC
jgi:hypothetical protein